MPSTLHRLERWICRTGADAFPYDEVLSEFHRVGKHHVDRELLAALSRARDVVPVDGGPDDLVLLRQFLGVALDKWDGRYYYVSYTGLPVLGLDHQAEAGPGAASDRLLALLVLDTLRFELAAVDGAPVPLPRMRPGLATVEKRCRLGLRATAPALGRLGFAVATVDDPLAMARDACHTFARTQTGTEGLRLRLSLVPVDTIHDEYLFIRVLQATEVVFGLIQRQLTATVEHLLAGGWPEAVAGLDRATALFAEAAPLFSLLATMQRDAFQTFRNYTEGASAIQSEGYKLVESLCRQPDAGRLDSVAYHSVPQVRELVLAGQASIDDVFGAVRRAGRLPEPDRAEVEGAMGRFALGCRRWRQTHYRLAARMLGDARGSGYTEGVPYLKSVVDIPVFAGQGVTRPDGLEHG